MNLIGINTHMKFNKKKDVMLVWLCARSGKGVGQRLFKFVQMELKVIVYDKVVSLLVEGIKELSQKVDKQDKEIKRLKSLVRKNDALSNGFNITGLTIVVGGSGFGSSQTYNLVVRDPDKVVDLGTCTSNSSGVITSTSISSVGANYSSGSLSYQPDGSVGNHYL